MIDAHASATGALRCDAGARDASETRFHASIPRVATPADTRPRHLTHPRHPTTRVREKQGRPCRYCVYRYAGPDAVGHSGKSGTSMDMDMAAMPMPMPMPMAMPIVDRVVDFQSPRPGAIHLASDESTREPEYRMHSRVRRTHAFMGCGEISVSERVSVSVSVSVEE